MMHKKGGIMMQQYFFCFDYFKFKLSRRRGRFSDEFTKNLYYDNKY